MANPKGVWIVHGRNKAAHDALVNFLLALGLSPMEWGEVVASLREGSPNITAVLDRAFEDAHAVVVLLTGDEIAYLQPQFASTEDTAIETKPNPQARPNVLFEAGLAFGRNPDRTVLVTIGYNRKFSNIAGRLAIKLSESAEDRKNLADRLRTIGCAVDMTNRNRWLSAGNFLALNVPGENKSLPTGDKVYYVIAARDGRVLDVNTGNGLVHQHEQKGLLNQRWRPVPTTDGHYFLFVEHSGKCLDVRSSSTNDKAPVGEYQFNGTDAQRWLLDIDQDGFRLINKGSRKALHAVEGNDEIYQLAVNGEQSQRWKFHPVSGV